MFRHWLIQNVLHALHVDEGHGHVPQGALRADHPVEEEVVAGANERERERCRAEEGDLDDRQHSARDLATSGAGIAEFSFDLRCALSWMHESN